MGLTQRNKTCHQHQYIESCEHCYNCSYCSSYCVTPSPTPPSLSDGGWQLGHLPSATYYLPPTTCHLPPFTCHFKNAIWSDVNLVLILKTLPFKQAISVKNISNKRRFELFHRKHYNKGSGSFNKKRGNKFHWTFKKHLFVLTSHPDLWKWVYFSSEWIQLKFNQIGEKVGSESSNLVIPQRKN